MTHAPVPYCCPASLLPQYDIYHAEKSPHIQKGGPAPRHEYTRNYSSLSTSVPMPPASEEVLFLISCVRNTGDGKVYSLPLPHANGIQPMLTRDSQIGKPYVTKGASLAHRLRMHSPPDLENIC